MQRLADYVRKGHFHHASGSVRTERAPRLCAKFVRLYEVHLHRNQRARRRADGEASAYCVWWRSHADTVCFALLLTDGPHAARKLEDMRDCRERAGRMELGDCELVQIPRANNSQASWTWRLTPSAYADWRARVLLVVRNGNPFEVGEAVRELLALPGFAGVRHQVKSLKALFRSEWKRRRGAMTCPPLGRQPYVQRLRNAGTPMSQLQ